MCYLQYLESRQFIGLDEQAKNYNSYLFGHLLQSSSADFDEVILLMLEMMRVFFPASEPIDVAGSHQEFHEQFSQQAVPA